MTLTARDFLYSKSEQLVNIEENKMEHALLCQHCYLGDLKTRKKEIHFSSQTSKFLINLLRFQISRVLIFFFTKHDYKVSRSFIEENKRYKRLKTQKWIFIRWLVAGLLLMVRSAGYLIQILFHIVTPTNNIGSKHKSILFYCRLKFFAV